MKTVIIKLELKVPDDWRMAGLEDNIEKHNKGVDVMFGQKVEERCKCGHLLEEHWSYGVCGADLKEGLTNKCDKCT